MFIGYQEKIIGYETKTEVNEQGETVEIQIPVKQEFIAMVAQDKEHLESTPCMTFTRIEETDKEYVLWGGEWILKEEGEVLKSEQEKKFAVQSKEAETGLTRAVRELVLAENSGASEYVRKQAQEIEALAAPLREVPNE